MRINRLQIENFRNHKQTSLGLEQINFFVGPNNAGKTSILAALEWGLTGRCLWTDKAGRGATDLLLQGSKTMKVSMEIDGLGRILRSLPPHTLQIGQTLGVNEGQLQLRNYLNTDENRLQVALNTNAFITLSQAEQRSFLFSAYGLSWTVEDIIEKTSHFLIDHKYSESEARRLAQKAKKYYPSGITGGPEIFEVMEKRAKEERREFKRAKQQVEAVLSEIFIDERERIIPIDLEESNIALSEMKLRRDELLKACGAHKEVELRRQTLLEKIRRTEGKVGETQETIEVLELELKRLRELEATTIKNEEEEQSVQAAFDSANTAAAAIRIRIESLNNAGKALTNSERRCPLAPDLLQCGLSQDQLDSILASLRDQYKLLSKDLKDQEATIQETSQKLASLRTSLEENRARSNRLLFLQSELNNQKNFAETLDTNLLELNKELGSLTHEDPNMLHDLAELEASIHHIEKSLAQYNEAQSLVSRQSSLAKDLDTLSSDIADLEVLIKALSPDGLRKEMLSQILNGFVQRVNNRLGQLTEGTYQISLAKDLSILCCVPSGPKLPIKLLSKSEQLRVSIAISEALSQAAGLQFLAIDEADMLDQENRDLLTEMLLNTANEFDQVFVFTTLGDIQPVNPNLPGVKMFWVDDGAVQEL